MIIYKVVNIINNKIYIGKTSKTLDERIKQHARKCRNSDLVFHKALNKYGIDNFKWEIIYECFSEIELNKKEIYYIKEYNSTNNNIGYNIHEGGNGGDNFKNNPNLEKIKYKMSKIKKDNPPQHLIHKSKEHIEKITSKLRGKKTSNDTKKKISEKIKKLYKRGVKMGMAGKHHTEETKSKMRNSRKNVIYTEEWKENLSKSHRGENHWNYGKKWNEDIKNKIRISNSIKIKCPNCGKIGGKTAMNRYHMDNCKYKKI